MLDGARILLVDTDADVRRVLTRVLERAAGCVTAADPVQATQRPTDQEPDLIVVEGQAMAEGSYSAVTLAARHPRCPLLILDMVPAALEEVTRTRRWEWLEKPVTPLALVAAAQRLVNRAHKT